MHAPPGHPLGVPQLLALMIQPGGEWLTLRLDGPLQPKERPRQGRGRSSAHSGSAPTLNERPRQGRGRSFTSPRYRAWLQDQQESLSEQWGDRETLAHALVAIEFHGHGRSDVDNLEGAVLDAAVRAGVFVDDRCSRIPGVLGWWFPAPSGQQVTFLHVLPWTPLKNLARGRP